MGGAGKGWAELAAPPGARRALGETEIRLKSESEGGLTTDRSRSDYSLKGTRHCQRERSLGPEGGDRRRWRSEAAARDWGPGRCCLGKGASFHFLFQRRGRRRDAGRPSAVGSGIPGPGPAALLAASRKGGGLRWAAAAPAGEAPNGRGRGAEPGSTESPSELRRTRGEHRAPRSAARLLPGPCPALPARPAALGARRRLHARSSLPARPAARSARPCASPCAGSVRTPRLHRGPGTAGRGSGRRGAGGRRCRSVVHPTRVERAGRAASGGKAAGPRSAPRLPARPGIVRGPWRRLSAQCPRCWEGCGPGHRARSARSDGAPPDPRLPEPGSARRTAQPPPAAGPAQPGPPVRRHPAKAALGAELCRATFLCLLMGVVASRRQVLRARPSLVFLRLERPISRTTWGLNAVGLSYRSSFVPRYLQSLFLWTFEDMGPLSPRLWF